MKRLLDAVFEHSHMRDEIYEQVGWRRREAFCWPGRRLPEDRDGASALGVRRGSAHRD